MTEDERQKIVTSGPVYLADGMKVTLGGWRNPDYCAITSAYLGFWACSWETAAAVIARPGRRFLATEMIWRTGKHWKGFPPGPDNYQTPEDYERAKAEGTAQ